LLLLLVSRSQADYCGPWIPLDIKDIPSASPSDQIEMYYLAAPLMYCTNLDEYTYIGGYHGGIGLVNKKTKHNITLSFQGFPSFKGSFLPVITKQSNGSYTFDWQNGARTYIYDSINYTYWHSLNQHVATLDGTQFNNLMMWVGKANSTYTHYNPWFVYESFPTKPVLKGFECFQFAVNTVIQAKTLGAKMAPGYDKLYVSLGTSYTHHAPVKVDWNDPVWHERILDFYLFLDEKWTDLGYAKFLEELYELVIRGDFFVRNDEDYYYYKLAYPFFEMHWAQLPIQSEEGHFDQSVPVLSK